MINSLSLIKSQIPFSGKLFHYLKDEMKNNYNFARRKRIRSNIYFPGINHVTTTVPTGFVLLLDQDIDSDGSLGCKHFL